MHNKDPSDEDNSRAAGANAVLRSAVGRCCTETELPPRRRAMWKWVAAAMRATWCSSTEDFRATSSAWSRFARERRPEQCGFQAALEDGPDQRVIASSAMQERSRGSRRALSTLVSMHSACSATALLEDSLPGSPGRAASRAVGSHARRCLRIT